MRDIGGFETLDLELDERLTLLTGVNGSGKSTVIEALLLSLCSILRSQGWFETAPGYDAPFPYFHWSPEKVRVGAESGLVRLALDGSTAQFALWPEGRTEHTATMPPPLFLHLGATRGGERAYERLHLMPSTLAATAPGRARALTSRVGAPGGDMHTVVEWFRREENIENEMRLQHDRDHRRPELEVVRKALLSVLTELEPSVAYSNPRISRAMPNGDPWPDDPEGRLVFDRNGVTLAFSQLSDGEAQVLATVMDIARRICIWWGPDRPMTEASAILLVDEVELHLHPGWQGRILPALLTTFPALQIVATTHSPRVVGSVDAAHVRVLRDFTDHPVGTVTLGRDANSLLEDVFDVDDRSDRATVRALDEVAHLIEDDRLDEARAGLARLRERLTASDPDVSRLDGLIEFLSA
ncbi:MAG: AAA family ATPase [Myxococcales bacterium]|nr:AAA family ATPase [Myxococcales bacterium]MCB9670295.1 AAA family ATPase [Alphaproteobacteria bacterium]